MVIHHFFKVMSFDNLDIGIDIKLMKKRAFIILKMSKPDSQTIS
jgi:hypothetical protein